MLDLWSLSRCPFEEKEQHSSARGHLTGSQVSLFSLFYKCIKIQIQITFDQSRIVKMRLPEPSPADDQEPRYQQLPSITNQFPSSSQTTTQHFLRVPRNKDTHKHTHTHQILAHDNTYMDADIH